MVSRKLRYKNLNSETLAKLPPFLSEENWNSGFAEDKKIF